MDPFFFTLGFEVAFFIESAIYQNPLGMVGAFVGLLLGLCFLSNPLNPR